MAETNPGPGATFPILEQIASGLKDLGVPQWAITLIAFGTFIWLVSFLPKLLSEYLGFKSGKGGGDNDISAWRTSMDRRVERIESQIWDIVRIRIVPDVKQPTHWYMDYLLDKLALKKPMTRNELESLHNELQKRLNEKEPDGRPGYHMQVMLTIHLVEHCLMDLKEQPEDAEALETGIMQQGEKASWRTRLRRWLS